VRRNGGIGLAAVYRAGYPPEERGRAERVPPKKITDSKYSGLLTDDSDGPNP